MIKKENIIQLTSLVNENLKELEKLNAKKLVLKEKYSLNPQDSTIKEEIKKLEKKYALLYKKSLQLNNLIKKYNDQNN